MRGIIFAGLLCALGAPLFQAQTIPQDEYRERRAKLRNSLDGTMVLFGRTVGQDEVFGFVQESNFYYLTGWTQPNAVLLLTRDQDILFLPHHDVRMETFTGKHPSAEDSDVKAVTGFDQVMSIEKLESQLTHAMETSEKVYTLPRQPGAEKLNAFLSLRETSDAQPLIAKLRVKKSPAEIAAIQHATDVSIEGHRATWKRLAAGLYEYQLSATFTDAIFEAGCERYAYSPIVGSGPNSTVLHYSSNRRRMDRGEVVVMDAAAECNYYASDITRTVPVGGRFSARERELYEIVLGAQKAALAATKPGARMSGEGNTLNKIARDYIDSHGKDLHGEKLGKYFTHGLGHPVGIDVHDVNYPGPLEAGMVITLEPGIYIPEEGIGIRIEDVVLVTENGARVLSAALPKEPDEVEKALAR
ncbi:MAG TPA: Xaa-Pro peptidase family protein [Bryobacteraceae bacterium]|nr:Xaa-Pro peptidase family protein [Bryobacteraceae bacterium]